MQTLTEVKLRRKREAEELTDAQKEARAKELTGIAFCDKCDHCSILGLRFCSSCGKRTN